MMGIGGHQLGVNCNFKLRTIKLDFSLKPIFYLFSDGYKDQFGGPDGKKIGSTYFKAILEKIHTREMENQHEILKAIFLDWTKSGLERQIDDILILGFQL